MDNRGSTLIEILIAILIFAIFIIPVHQTIVESFDITYRSNDETEANLLAQKYLEEFKENPSSFVPESYTSGVETLNYSDVDDEFDVELTFEKQEDLGEFTADSFSESSSVSIDETISVADDEGTSDAVLEIGGDESNSANTFDIIFEKEDTSINIYYNADAPYEMTGIDASFNLKLDFQNYANNTCELNFANNTSYSSHIYLYNLSEDAEDHLEVNSELGVSEIIYHWNYSDSTQEASNTVINYEVTVSVLKDNHVIKEITTTVTDNY